MNWIEEYKGGFENSDGYEEINFFLNKKESNEFKLLFEAYDSNFYALPNASSWDKKWLKKQVEFLKSCISEEFTGDVWLDDVLVIGKGYRMSKLIFKCSNCSNIRMVEDEHIG